MTIFFGGSKVLSLIASFINICLKMMRDLSSKFEMSFATVMTFSFKRKEHFRTEDTTSSLEPICGFQKSLKLTSEILWSYVQVVMLCGKN